MGSLDNKYWAAFEYSTIGIVLGDENGNITEANPEVQSLLGYTKSELQNMNVADFSCLENSVNKRVSITGIQNNKLEKYRTNIGVVSKSGETIWVELAVTEEKDDDGGLASFIAMVVQVFDKGIPEEKASLPNMLYMYNVDEKENTFLSRQVKYENNKDHIKHKGLGINLIKEQICQLGLPPSSQNMNNTATIKGEEMQTLEYSVQTSPDRNDWYREASSIFSYDEEGNPKEIIGSVTNITEFKNIEFQLEQLKKIIDTSVTAINIISHEGKYIYANKAYINMLGYDHKSEILGRSFDSHCAEKDMFLRVVEILRENGKFKGELKIKRKDGSFLVKVLYFYLALCPDGKETYYTTSVETIDINDNKWAGDGLRENTGDLKKLVEKRTSDLEVANKKLITTNEELSQKNEIIEAQNYYLLNTLNELKDTQAQLIESEKMASIGVLTAGIAHEINNPLNFIMGGFLGLESILSDDSTITVESGAKFFYAIKLGLERATAIVDGLNTFSRKNESLEEECDIHSILENCLVILSQKLKRRIKVVKQLNAHQYIVKGNVGKLHQVFLNIILNASQSIQDRGVIIISTYNQFKSLNIEITDTGSGISKENIAKLTDPFFTTKKPGQGTGLGLYISHEVLQKHKGSIEFRSEINKGTTVLINLPV